MQADCPIALKEWAVVCAALAAGRQTVLLRTGGIAEGPDGFVVQQPAFWLYPTRFHQSAGELIDEATPLLHGVRSARPAEGTVHLSLYATVEAIFRIHEPSQLTQLGGLHILSAETVQSRFEYRDPGLFVLVVRVYRRPRPIVIVDEPRFAGCHSWVELDQSLSTDDLHPVMSDDAFTQSLQEIHSRLKFDSGPGQAG